MKKILFMILTIAWMLPIAGCSCGSKIHFSNTSSMSPSWNLVLYDSSGNLYRTIGPVATGTDTADESIDTGDYYVVAIDSGSTSPLAILQVTDGNNYICNFYSQVLNGTTSYGCTVDELSTD